MRNYRSILPAAVLALACAASPALAHPPIGERPTAEEQAAFNADRADILAMAGNYKVRFDMQESTPWAAGYAPLERKISGGYESVRVIEDTGERIVLQHLLVVEHEGKTHVIKHWRQDWDYEPARILVYAGPDTAIDPVNAREDKTMAVSLSLRVPVTARTLMTGEVSYSRRESNYPTSEYDNLAATIGLELNF